ncbi:DMT family transporter [Erythrobacter dokdonensis]|uniref:Putative transporter, RarD family, DMT superfamily protein n=1 Tax=Erythrobacter dokdonensis DSW-74 TaxID=1300349 RepID=A0A1A7BIA9_9SPHN|nr:DMT family transporter [Erythrobacter dokdonensis]OBV11456.1 putative transporter, RarD family, DMT superfamily protein [Erythrobacter dokdonensis DSW-74]
MDGSIARPRPLLALGIRLLTAAALATMAMLVKLAGTRGAHLVELIFWRQLLTAMLLAAGLALTGRLAMLRTRRLGAHARRAATGLLGMIFTYGAVLLLPLAEATTLSFTAPIFAVLIALALFSEKIGPYRWAAVGIGFAGVLVVMQPFGALHEGVTVTGVIVGLVAPFMVALISFQIQDLNTTENPWSIVFWFAALSAPVAALALPFVITAHDPETWGIIIAMALIGAVAQMLLTTSLRFGSAAVILLMDYTALLWASFYGYYIFDRAAPASLWLGAPLIIGAGVLIAWRERQLARERTAASRAGQE